MHYLLATIDGKPVAAPGVRIRNCLGGYVTFELGPYARSPFGVLAQPVTLTLIGSKKQKQLSIHGITCAAEGMLVGHSRAGLLDVAPRSNRFETAAPQKLLAALTKDYPQPPVIECTVKEHANKPVEQHNETDFDFLSHAIPHALIFDTGEKLRIIPKADLTHAVTREDMPDGSGSWSADVTHVALSAAAHCLDPGEKTTVKVEKHEMNEYISHPEIMEFFSDVARFMEMIPPAKFLTTGRSSEGLRKRLQRTFWQQLAQALRYTFHTANGAIGVGTRLTGLSRGPLVVAITHGHFVDGDFMQEVTAVPEPLAPLWGYEPAAAAETLVLATIAEGTDPLHLGRVPIYFADQPTQIVWARGVTLHAAKSFQLASRFAPGEEVIVGFLHDNPGAPVVLGSVFHGKNKPQMTAAHELLIQCGKMTVRLSELGFDVLIGDSQFGITAEGITFKGKTITGQTDAHKLEMK